MERFHSSHPANGSVIAGHDGTSATPVNGIMDGAVQSESRQPFGGIKATGFGRELGRHGLAAVANLKSLTVHGEAERG